MPRLVIAERPPVAPREHLVVQDQAEVLMRMRQRALCPVAARLGGGSRFPAAGVIGSRAVASKAVSARCLLPGHRPHPCMIEGTQD